MKKPDAAKKKLRITLKETSADLLARPEGGVSFATSRYPLLQAGAQFSRSFFFFPGLTVLRQRCDASTRPRRRRARWRSCIG
jgi:hypothetical protein